MTDKTYTHATYQTTCPTFIAPNLLPEGVKFTINWAWEPGNHVLSLDEAAEARFEKYYAEKPHAAGLVIQPSPVEQFNAHVVGEGTIPKDAVLDLAEVLTKPAQPGPTEAGGKIAQDLKK